MIDFHMTQRVWWDQQPRGGYGAFSKVPAIVFAVGDKRIQIAAELKDGNTKLVWVKPDKLTPREAGE